MIARFANDAIGILVLLLTAHEEARFARIGSPEEPSTYTTSVSPASQPSEHTHV
jgi:hypothetical protein